MWRQEKVESRQKQSATDSHVLLGLGIGFLGLAGTALGLSFPVKDEAAVVILRVMAVVLAGFALGLSFAWLLQRSQRVMTWIAERRDYDIAPLPVGVNLQNVVRAGRRAIGDAHPDEGTLLQRLEENGKILSVWGRKRASGRIRFCGYILLYPLSDETGKEILSGRIRSEREFGEAPLIPSFEDARFIYVGMVLGSGVHAKSRIKALLRSELYELLAKGQVEKVFARKGSKGGRKLMQQYRFRPLLPEHGEDGVWFVGAAALRAQLFAEQTPLVESWDPKQPIGDSGDDGKHRADIWSGH